MKLLCKSFILLPLVALDSTAFQLSQHAHRRQCRIPSLAVGSTANTVDSDTYDAGTPRTVLGDGLHKGLYTADRYTSTLRFLVPKGEEQVAFEHTWTARAKELAATPGLKYFHMGKRGADFMGPPLPDDEFNYQSFAVWESKEAYDLCIDSNAVDFGTFAESPANYDGLFALAVPTSISGVAGMPNTASDTTTTTASDDDSKIDTSKRLPREAFVASNRFGIKPGFEKDFEDMWAGRDSSLADLPGFVNFQLLRRDGSSEDDGNTYVSYTTWDSLGAFNNWRESDNFKRSHSSSGEKPKESPYAKMPKVVTFKTFLVVSGEDGM